MAHSDHQVILEQIRAYLREGFPTVTLAHAADAKTGCALINIFAGRKRLVLEITETFLDADARHLEPLAALRKWDLIGALKGAEPGSILRVTTAGLRVV